MYMRCARTGLQADVHGHEHLCFHVCIGECMQVYRYVEYVQVISSFESICRCLCVYIMYTPIKQ